VTGAQAAKNSIAFMPAGKNPADGVMAATSTIGREKWSAVISAPTGIRSLLFDAELGDFRWARPCAARENGRDRPFATLLILRVPERVNGDIGRFFSGCG